MFHLTSSPSNSVRDSLSTTERRDLDKFSFLAFIQGSMPGGKLQGIEKEMLEEGAREFPATDGAQMLSYKAMSAGTGGFRNDVTAGGSGTGSQAVA